ncbi:glycosyltransferase involved in cell wall biosynthesis [Actinoallomurus bryophytorum]|uniref:Glycosyltransferase involved in cell wall biosynthesis n=1 Tax=Actinoallomurus bryophytorum TaxID=1490222 RepID=A0A543CQD2_9ACTN|nr:glycosyltransferase family 2 protein [Actinoallomurus bryophytorum]TQL99314.1 glycosyltransferase involved in cell wall biosynthesis [Actinoallomurus bryophytorum]
MRIDVVLPCLNEADALPAVVAALPSGFDALVVDNGSTDGTDRIAAGLGARVVHESHRGYGAAVHTGLQWATTDLVAFIDADGSIDPAALIDLAAVVAAGRADLAVGRRIPVDRSAQPWHARAGNAVLAALLRHRGAPVHDVAPIRVADRGRLIDLNITDRAFGYPLELLLRAVQAGWRIHEIDVPYRARAGGKSKVSGSVRGTLRAARDMTKVACR